MTVDGDGTEFQDGFGAVEAPAGSADVEAVGVVPFTQARPHTRLVQKVP